MPQSDPDSQSSFEEYRALTPCDLEQCELPTGIPALALSSRSPPDEASEIEAGLAQRRRKLGLGRRKTPTGTPEEREYNNVTEEDIRAYKEAMERHVDLIAYNNSSSARALEVGQSSKRSYAWDVMFENQRGIYFLGKAYFSSRGLLPSDPTPFTLPSVPLAGTVRDVDSSHQESEQPKPRININTEYDLETFQTPTPAWEWLTTWMVNMRPTGDEQGWCYNAWFRQRGWKRHAGPVGWGGWVRRREWVRLRATGSKDGQRVKSHEIHIDRLPTVHLPESLAEVLRTKRPIELVRKTIGQLQLDRQRLAKWKEWLSTSDTVERKDLAALLSTEQMNELAHMFTHTASSEAFQHMLIEYGIVAPA